MTAPLVVFAVGNPSRGDDAIGPLLCQQLTGWLAAEGLTGLCDLIEDFQLQIEHSLDLRERQLALFIDAGSGTPAPYSFRRIAPIPNVGHSTHALEPPAVLQVYADTQRQPPPSAFVLCVRGEQFELGADLSDAARTHVAAAFDLLKQLCRNHDPAAWVAWADGAAAVRSTTEAEPA